MLNKDSIEHLNKFYSKLYNNITLKKKLKKGSIIISFFNIKSNESYKLLDESAIESTNVPKEYFDLLVSSNYIRMTDKLNRYVITAKGIWLLENNKGNLDNAILIENIDEKYFNLFGEILKLTEKEKIIILSMIAVRSFSRESVIDLKKGDTTLNVMHDLIGSTYDVLSWNKIIMKLNKDELFGSKGNEHPVSNLIRHTDALLKKTKGIYKTLGKQKYFLDLQKDSSISQDALVLLLNLIFEETMTPQLKEEISKFCNDNAYSRSAYIFDMRTHKFAKPSYDGIINESLENYFISKYKQHNELL